MVSISNFLMEAVTLGLFASVNIGLAVWKLVLFVRFYGRLKTCVAIFVLALEIMSNLSKSIPHKNYSFHL